MRILLLAILAITSITQVKAQALLSGFSLQEKEKVVAIGYGADVASQYFIKSEAVDLARTIDVIGVYGAVGFKNNWNAVLSYALIDFTPQDFRIGVSKRYGQKQNWYAVIGGGFYGPTSDYETEGLNAIGQHNGGVWVENVIQKRMNASHLDIALTANLNYEVTPSNIQTSLAYGLSRKNMYIKGFAAYQHSFGNKFYRGIGEEAPSTFKELAVSYAKVGAQVIYTKSEWQPYLGLAQTLWGQNAFKATAFSVGVIKKF